MKKVYAKPHVEVEVYQVDAAIAANCTLIINVGPGSQTLDQCSDYEGSFDMNSFKNPISTFSVTGTPFYENRDAGCDCYYTSGDRGYFTS